LQQVYERVVIPLEQELWNGFKVRMGSSQTVEPNVLRPAQIPLLSPKPGQKKTVRIYESLESVVPEGILLRVSPER
jgi:hypothetical protein